MAMLRVGSGNCRCGLIQHRPIFVALTGGPGAGKTAILEMAQRSFCSHVAILPEAAGIVFGGGFPRDPSEVGRRAAQRAIFHMQREVERLVEEEGQVAIALCDRGTVDGLAYWPGSPEAFWKEVATDYNAELARYSAVIHLETPSATRGYNHQNPTRVESAEEAKVIDDRIKLAWKSHPRHFVVSSAEDFLDKAIEALRRIREQLPVCCRSKPAGA